MRNILLSLSMLSVSAAFALPTDYSVQQGATPTVTTNGSAMSIVTGSTTTVLNWDSFSIGSSETVNFSNTGNGAYNVFNMVTGASSTAIAGSLYAQNGNIYIINPNGINVATTGVIYAAGYTLSTLIPNSFDPTGNIIYAGSSTNSVVNQGATTALVGDAILIGFRVQNTGSMEAAGMAGLAAGTSVLVQPSGADDRIIIQTILPNTVGGTGVEISGTITALNTSIKADGNAYALAINQTGGAIQASGCSNAAGGGVLLVANPGNNNNGSVQLGGSIGRTGVGGTGCNVTILGYDVALLSGASINTAGNVGGGNIIIGGDGIGTEAVTTEHVYIDTNASVIADGLTIGSGGSISYYGADSALVLGTLRSRGGSSRGNGGTLSGTGVLYHGFGGSINLSSPRGTLGTATLTAQDFLVSADADWGACYQPPSYNDCSQLSVITTLAMQKALNNNNLTILAQGGGDITVVNPLTWTTPNTNLTLNAEDTIQVNALVTGLGASRPGQDIITLIAQDLGIGTVGFTQTVPVGFLLTAGSISLDINNDVNLYGGALVSNFAAMSTSSGGLTGVVGGNLYILSGPADGADAFFAATTVLNIDSISPISAGNIHVVANDCSSAYMDITGGVINIGLNSPYNNLVLQAGCCSSNDQAYIGSISGSATINSMISGDYLITGGTSGMNNTAAFYSASGSNNDFSIVGRNLNLVGGTGGTGNAALIANYGNGAVNIQMAQDIALTAGPSSANGASVVIWGQTTNLLTGSDLNLVAGGGMMDHALIYGVNGLNITAGGHVAVTGGVARESFAALRVNTGDLTIDSISGGVLSVTGGLLGQENSYALIEIVRNGNISIGQHHPFEDLLITAGNAGSASFALIQVAGDGDISVGVLGDVNVLGGKNGLQTFAGIVTQGVGNIHIDSFRDVIATTGNNPPANVFFRAMNGSVEVEAARDVILTGSCSIPNLASIESYGLDSELTVATGRDLLLVRNAKLIGSGPQDISVGGEFALGGCGGEQPEKQVVLVVPANVYELFWRINTFTYYDWYGLSTDDFWIRANYTDGPEVQ